LATADLVEKWINDLRDLAHQILESGEPVAGYKLVPKRAMRQWVDEDKAYFALSKLGVDRSELVETALLSPAKVEKILKKSKLSLPDDIVVAVSSGTTIAPESDPRSAVVFLPEQMKTALLKLG
jgi:3-hydroxyisobutyrate dehydrogenase-like beta-hydroxyacid dehydrogenase